MDWSHPIRTIISDMADEAEHQAYKGDGYAPAAARCLTAVVGAYRGILCCSMNTSIERQIVAVVPPTKRAGPRWSCAA